MTLTAEEGAGASSLPAPDKLRTISMIANEAAGAASSSDVSAVAAKVQEALPEAAFTLARVSESGMDGALDAAFSNDPDAVIVFGGDGTARAAAKRAMATQTPIAPLPGGTMNVLAKLVYGHDDLDKCILDLRSSYMTALDAGIVSGEPFFLSAAFGFAGPLARLRESMRPPRKFNEVSAAMASVARGIGPSIRGGIKWRRSGAKWRHAQTLVVALGSLDRVLDPAEQDMETGARMQVASLRLRSGWDIARVASDAVRLRDWRELDHVMVASARRVELELASRRPLAVLDGEPMRLSNAHEITVSEKALPVLAARLPAAS